MLQPRKPLDLSSAQEILSTERPPLNLSEAQDILKKKEPSQLVWEEKPSDSSTQPTFIQSLLDTGKPTKPSVSGTSSGVVKTTKPLKPEVKKESKEEVSGFGEGLLNRLDTGIARISKSIYDAPKMLLDAIYVPQNYLAEKLNIPSLRVDPETYAYENIPSKNMDKIMSENDTKIASYKKAIGGDVMSSFDKGDYVNTLKHAALDSMESAPLIATTLATGGSSLLANSIMIGSSASTQYDQLSKENPEMETATKLANSAVNGALEVVVGKYMEGITGNVWKTLLKDKGADVATSIATNSFKKSLEKVIGDSPIVGVAGEYAEERITDAFQQLNNISTGAATEFDWNQNKGAGLSSLGFGLPNAAALYGTKAYISNRTKKQVSNTSKQIVKLQNELQNPDLSDENKKIISESITEIYDKNKKLLGDELGKLSIIPESEQKELFDLDKNIDKAKSDAIDIKYDVNISDENKVLLLKKLEDSFKESSDRKDEILGNVYNNQFKKLDVEEQNTLKEEANKALQKEFNPDGTREYKPTEDEIVKKAISIKNEEALKAKEDVKVDEVKPTEVTEVESIDEQKADIEKKYDEEIQKVKDTSPEEQGYSGFNDAANKINSKREAEIKALETPKAEVITPIAETTEVTELEKVGPKPKPTSEESIKASNDWINNLFNQKNGTKISDENGNIYEIKDGKLRKLTFDENKNIVDSEVIYQDARIYNRGTFANPDFFNNGYKLLSEKIKTETTEAKVETPTAPESKIIEYNKQEYYKNEEGTWVNNKTGNEIKGIGSKGKSLINSLNAKEKNPTKKYKLTERGQAFNVEYKNGKLEVTKSDGSKVSKTTELAVLRKHADNYDFTQGEKAMDRMDFEGQDWDNEVAKKSNNPAEVAEAVDYASFEDISNLTPEERVSFKDEIIFDGIGKIKEDGFDRFGDRNKKTDKTAKEYFDEEGRDIDDLAAELSDSNGIEVSPNDIAEFIERHPNGKKEFKTRQKENLTQEQITKNNKVLDLKNKFTELTGLPATPEFLLKAVEQAARKFAGHDTLDQLSDAQLEAKYNEIKQFEEQQYGKQAEKVIETTKRVDEVKDTKDTGEVQEGVEKVGVTKKDLKQLEKDYEINLAERRDKITDVEMEMMAKDLIDSGYDVNSLVKKCLGKDTFVPSPLEFSVLSEHAADMKAKIDSNSSDADIAKYRDILSAINRSTSEYGRGLRMTQIKKDVIDSIADVMSHMMDDYGLDFLTETQRTEAEVRFKIIEKSLNEHKEALDKVTAELERLKAEKAVNGLSSKGKRDALAKSSKTSQEYSAERKEIVKNIKDKWNKVAKGGGPITAVPIPFSQQIAAIAPDVARLISSYLEQGVAVTLDEVRALLKKDIQDAGIDITDNEVNRLIAGEGAVKKESKNELMRQKYQIQQEQKLLIELEKLENGEKQPKTERKRVEKNQRLTELRKKIKELTGEDLDEKFIQTARQRIKTNEAKANEINEKIKAGDFSKEEKPKSVLDIELLQENNKELYEDYLKSVEDKHEAMYNYELSRQADKIKNENTLNKINRYADIAINTSKGTVAMFDQSYFLVQMLPFTLSNPLKAVRFAKQALARDFVNAQKFKRDMTILHESPLYDLIKKTGLAILEPRSFESELRSELHGGEKNLWNKEFEFKGKKYSVGQAFERSTTSFMNNARLSLFNNGVEKLYQSGKTFENAPEEFNSLARAINELTGQGKVQKQVQMASPIVNKIIWSPKMFASTLNILGLGDIIRPVETSKAIGRGLGLKIKETDGSKGFYTSLTPTQRKFALKELSRFVGTGALIMIIAKLNSDEDDDVDIDPRSSGFGSITIGNKKYNIFGRFSSAARTVVQVAGGVRVVKGKEVELGKKFGSKTAGGVVYGSFVRGKMTPSAGLAADLILNNQKNYFTGEDIDFLTATKNLTVPLAIQDLKKDFTRDDVLTASATTIAKLYGANISDERDFGNKREYSKPKTQEEMEKSMREAMKKVSEQMKKERRQ